MLDVSVSNLNKSYVLDDILIDLSFNINKGDKIGLIGPNGSGKTTLMSILAGELEADSGSIYLRKDLELAYLEQNISLSSDRTIYQECLANFGDVLDLEKNIRLKEKEMAQLEGEELDMVMTEYSQMIEEFNSHDGYSIDSNIKGTLKGLGFNDEDFDKKVSLLSGGEKSRLYLAILLLRKPDLLLLDEPTNHLDIQAINWLEKYLRDYDGSLLIISHDRYFLDSLVNRIFLIHNKSILNYNTNYSNFVKRREKDLELERRKLFNQERELKRQREIIERYKSYGSERYQRLARSRERLVEKMDLIEEAEEEYNMSFELKPRVESGLDVLKIDKLAKSFPDKKLFENISFNLYKGDRVGLIGPNGVGKTSLFKILLGKDKDYSGTYKLGSKVEIGYFDQEMKNLSLDKTIIDEIWDENPRFTHFDIRRVLAKFVFLGDDIFKEIGLLSGGERGRLSLLKLLLSKGNLLLLDEPTNHLDIESKEILENALLDYSGTILVISHDRYFLNRVCDKIIELSPDGAMEFLGNYDYYLKKKEELSQKEEEDAGGKTQTQLREERKKERQLERDRQKLNRAIKDLEDKIGQMEEELVDIDNKLADNSLYDNMGQVLEYTERREAISSELDGLYHKLIEISPDN